TQLRPFLPDGSAAGRCRYRKGAGRVQEWSSAGAHSDSGGQTAAALHSDCGVNKKRNRAADKRRCTLIKTSGRVRRWFSSAWICVHLRPTRFLFLQEVP